MASPAPSKVLQELLQLELGLKRAIKVEHVAPGDEEMTVRRLAAERGLAVIDDAEPEPSQQGRVARPARSLFLGPDRSHLEELRHWSRTQRNRRTSGERHDALRHIGHALGYPSCCVEAYIRGREFPDQSLLYLRPAFGTEGVPRALLNLAGNDQLVSHVPCSYACGPSLALAQATATALAGTDPDGWRARHARLHAPVLVLGERGAVRFTCAEDDEPLHDRVRFSAVDTSGLCDRALAAAFARADMLVCTSGSWRLLARGSLVHEEGRKGPLDLPVLLRFEGPPRRRLAVTFVDLHRSKVDFMDTMTLALMSGDSTHLGLTNEVVRQYGDRERPERWGESRARLVRHLVEGTATWVVWHMAFDSDVAAAVQAAGKRGVLIDGRFAGDPLPFDWVLRQPSRQYFARASRLFAEGADLLQVPGLLARSGAGWRGKATLQRLPRLERVEDATFWPNTVYTTLPGEYRPAGEVWHLSVNPGCPYGKRIEENDAFRELVFPEGVSTRGCSFCEEGGDYDGVSSEQTATSLLFQLEYLARRAPHGRWVVLERAVFRLLARFLERAAVVMAASGRTQGRPEFHVTARTDELVREEHHLVEAVEVAERLGLSLVLYLVGFESFSQRALDLFNKGTTVETQLAAIALIRRLEREHGRTFTASRSQSHGFLLFTPWTTVEELRENAARMRETRFWELRSEATLSKLRLYATAPLYYKARAEGLLADGFAAGESMSERLGYSHEAAWRFVHAEVAAVYRLLMTQVDAYPRGAREVDLLDLAIAAVEAEGPEADATAFVERWRRTAPVRPNHERPDLQRLDLDLPPTAVEGSAAWERARRELARRLLTGRALGAQEVVLRADHLVTAARGALWVAAAATRAGYRSVGVLAGAALFTPERLAALARVGVTRVLPWVFPGPPDDAELDGCRALDATTLEVMPVFEVTAATLTELPALADRAARLHPRAGALGLAFRPGELAHQLAGPGELPILRLQETAHAWGLPLRAVGPPPPPCAFECVRALRDLFSFTREGERVAHFERVPTCVDCAVRTRCPGVHAEFSRGFPGAVLHGLRDDITR